MSFQKVGTPQPLNIVPELCQKCGKNKAEFNLNSMFVCSECKQQLENSAKTNEQVN
jgi:ribosomal protein L37AE/L43A